MHFGRRVRTLALDGGFHRDDSAEKGVSMTVRALGMTELWEVLAPTSSET